MLVMDFRVTPNRVGGCALRPLVVGGIQGHKTSTYVAISIKPKRLMLSRRY